MNIIRFMLLFVLLICTSCGGKLISPLTINTLPTTLTASQVYTPSLNTVWTFQNSYGDLTWITQQAPTPSDYLPAGSVNWVFQKNAARAYWGSGIADALLHFVLVPQPDGSWISPASLFYFPTQMPAYMNGSHQGTSNFIQVAGQPIPYTIIPAGTSVGVKSDVTTQYDRWDNFSQYTFNSIITTNLANARVNWRTVSYLENVTTPVYTGLALVSEQFEGTCIHEKWYFAPGLGLVKIIPLDNGSCTPADPNLTIVRIS